MVGTWALRLKTAADRNRPRRKPQLWEDFALAVRRRLAFEVRHRVSDGWLDRAHRVELSGVGFRDGQPALRMDVVPREMMNKAIFLYGVVEISETRLVQALLAPGMTFVDVGANIGYYSLIAARLVGGGGAVYSFEPSGEVRAALERHVALNGFSNVVISGEAVAETTGEMRFYVSATAENSGISSLMPGAGLGAAQVVPSVTLDEVARRIGRRIDLVKVDVEGAEMQVIGGGQALLSSAEAPALLFESFDVGPMASALRALGYHVRQLHYTLEGGLELPDADTPVASIFAAYEPPNYFAAKDEALFARILARANADRPSSLRLLGRL